MTAGPNHRKQHAGNQASAEHVGRFSDTSRAVASATSSPELLAPAGSLDAVRAAVANGADAVYLGAERFNARDEGAQLTLAEVGAACRVAHDRGARVYLTFNILLKPDELEPALGHLGECVDQGIDAAIVQDLGAVSLIRSLYPELEIHGSTQMTVHDPAGARVIASHGIARAVLARENTLEDIAAIHAAVPALGLESFIHGALCIAYSGQCYMSGMISDRSANRGSCAQSCRKEYVLTDGLTQAALDRGYLISAKDLAAYEHLPAIARAGVRCLKIEGRKKKPEYVATVTAAYRRFLDRLAAGDLTPPGPESTQPLVQIFSRGFTSGMYGGRQGREYVTRRQPDNRGAVLGTVRRSAGETIEIEVTSPVRVGDGLGFEHPEGPDRGNIGFAVRHVVTLRHHARGGLTWQAMTLPRGTVAVPAGWIVVRSADAALLDRARHSYQHMAPTAPSTQIPLDIAVAGQAGHPLVLQGSAAGRKVTVRSAVALAPARAHALDTAKLREQIGRLGNTAYHLGALDRTGLPDGLFLPVRVLNDLRRQAVATLDAARAERETAHHAERRTAVARAMALTAPASIVPETPCGSRLVVEVWRLEDARAAVDAGALEISLDLFLRHPTPPVRHVQALADELRGRGVVLRLRTPTIVRPPERRVVDKWLALDLPVVSGHLGLVAELAAAGRDVVADYAVNAFNPWTADFLFRCGARRIVLSVELTTAEMAQVTAPWGGHGFEVLVHGRPEGMTIEHCVLSAAFDRRPTTCRDLCVQDHPHVALTDPAGYTFPLATDSACRNRLLHSRPVDAAECLPALWEAGLRSYRLVFNVPGDPVRAVTAAYREALDALATGGRVDSRRVREPVAAAFTRGHFVRAV